MDTGPPTPQPEPPNPRQRTTRRNPETRTEKLPLLSGTGKLLVPELNRIRSEVTPPLERLDPPPDLPPGYLCRQRRSLPSVPPVPVAPTPAELRSSCDVLCAGRFPAGLSSLLTGMQSPPVPRRRAGSSGPDSGRGGAGR